MKLPIPVSVQRISPLLREPDLECEIPLTLQDIFHSWNHHQKWRLLSQTPTDSEPRYAKSDTPKTDYRVSSEH